jgi:hypothetical protein
MKTLHNWSLNSDDKVSRKLIEIISSQTHNLEKSILAAKNEDDKYAAVFRISLKSDGTDTLIKVIDEIADYIDIPDAGNDDEILRKIKQRESLGLGWATLPEFEVGDEVIDSAKDKFRITAILEDGSLRLEDLFPSGRVKEFYYVSPEHIIDFEIKKIEN